MGPPTSRPVPWAKMTASGPYFVLDVVEALLSTVSRASSQLMRSNVPSPRSPTRFSGWVKRSGW